MLAELKIELREGRKVAGDAFRSDLSGEWTLSELLQTVKAELILISDRVLKDEQSKGFDKAPIVVVDGVKDRSPSLVHPLGKIEFVSNRSSLKIVAEAYKAVIEKSKVDTGLYKRSHFVTHNGNQVASTLDELNSWLATNPSIKAGDNIRIVNIVPYARRLELLGVTKERTKPRTREIKRKGQTNTKIAKVPSGVYALTARAISSKYKNNVKIKFMFISGAAMGVSGNFKKGRNKKSIGRPYLYPSLLFTVTPGGEF